MVNFGKCVYGSSVLIKTLNMSTTYLPSEPQVEAKQSALHPSMRSPWKDKNTDTPLECHTGVNLEEILL